MTEQPKGHCKHGEFILTEGCPQCIAERRAADNIVEDVDKELERIEEELEVREAREAEALGEAVPEPEPELFIVKVQYFSETSGEAFGREYCYFSLDPLKVGDVVMVPMRDRVQKAVVTEIDIPEAEIESFREQVKTIPSGSIIPNAQAPPEVVQEIETTKVELPMAETPPVAQVAKLFDQETEVEILPALNTLHEMGHVIEPGLLQAAQNAKRLLEIADARTITKNEDLKPAVDDLAIIGNSKKIILAKKAEILAPFKSQVEAINAAFAELLKPLEEADEINRGKVSAFTTEQNRLAAEAKRIEDEKLKLAKAEMELKGEHTQDLGTVEAPPPPPKLVRTGMATLGGRVNWKYEITDFALLPDEYKLPNKSLLTSFAASTKGTKELPGVRIYSEQGVTVRTR